MELNSTYGNFINLPIQFMALVIGFIYIKKIRLSKNDVLIIGIYLFIPTIILYLAAHWAGTIYLFLSLTTFFFWHTKKISAFFYISTLFLIAILSDHVASILVFNIYIMPERVMLQLLLRISIFIILYTLSMLVFKAVRKFFRNKINPSLNIYIVLIIIILVTVIVFYINIFRFFNNYKFEILKTNLIIFTVYLFLIFTLITILLYIVLKAQSLAARENEYENFSTYVASLEQVNKDMQKFRHDYLNILLSMRGYISEKDWEGLETYFEKGILKFEKKTLVSNKILGNLENLQVKGLKGLLFTKSSRAIEHDLNISIEIDQPIKDIAMDIIELNRILGILIDNALESCREEKKKEIQIAIIKQAPGLTMFVIRNQIKERDINISQLFEEGFTTKATGQGMGLATVKKIIDSNPNTTLNMWIDHNWFCVELLIMEG